MLGLMFQTMIELAQSPLFWTPALTGVLVGLAVLVKRPR